MLHERDEDPLPDSGGLMINANRVVEIEVSKHVVSGTVEILWEYCGDIVEILWIYFGNIVGIFWKYFRNNSYLSNTARSIYQVS